MIQSISAYKVGERVFPTIEEAQQNELLALMGAENSPTESDTNSAAWIVAHTDDVVAILTCQPKSKAPRKPRSDIGKKRAKKDETTAAL